MHERIRDNMRISIIQHDIKWNALEENLHHIKSLMDCQPAADLYVLAETFATGFMAEGTKEHAEEHSHRILEWMLREARLRDAAVAGSVVVVENEKYSQAKPHLRNRLYFVHPDGSYDYYDKRHLFGYAGEKDGFAAGEKRIITTWRGVRFLLQVCYDLRFPVFSRNRGDYDAIIYVANWPASRRDAWNTLLKARAIENQCFVVGVNRVGSDKSCNYTGDSIIIDAHGHPVVSCMSGKDDVAAAELDMNDLQNFRKAFPVLEDRD